MGEAKRRGTYQERRSAAIKKSRIARDARIEQRNMERLKDQPDMKREKSKILEAMSLMIVGTSMAGHMGPYGKRKGWR